MVLPPGTRSGSVSSRLLTTALLVLVVAALAAPTSSFLGGAVASSATPALLSQGAPHTHVGSREVANAIATLAHGQGPARGQAVHCTAVGVNAHCADPLPGSHLPKFSHATARSGVSNPYGWLNSTESAYYGFGSPSISFGAMMTWDELDGFVLYYGGCDLFACPDNSTWAFAGGLWYDITNYYTVSPPGVYLGSMDYDYQAKAVVLFGGCDWYACPDNETWLYSFYGGWVNYSAPVTLGLVTYFPPPAREAATMAFANDSNDDVTILYGGCLDSNCVGIDGTTWVFCGCFGFNLWYPLPTTGPSPRYDSAMAFDNVTGSLVLFGGCGGSNLCGYNDTWSFLNGTWQNVSSLVLNFGPAPSGRGAAMMTWDSALGEIIMIGGYNSTGYLPNDTWALYCFFACGWVNITPSLNLPGDVLLSALPTESTFYAPILIGGECTCDGGYLVGTWIYEQSLTLKPIVTPNPGPARTAFDFTSNPVGGTQPYYPTWSYGDGAVGFTDGSYNYSTPGVYVANASVSDWVGVIANASVTVTVTSTVATAQASPSATDVGRSVTFSSPDPTGGTAPYGYTWSFGDGSSASTATNPTHAYASAGSYQANLSVVDANGLYSNTSVTVTVVPMPTVTAAAAPAIADLGSAITFTATPAGGTGSFTFEWNFSDGSTSTQASPTHTYSASGTYTVWVTATDAVGGWANHSVSVTVYPTLTGTASASPTSANTSDMVAFTASGSGGSGTYSYHWAYGDGASATGGSVTHAYTSAGTYTAKVWINDTAGGSTVQSVAVSVHAPSTGGGSNSSASNGGLGGWALWIVLIIVVVIIALVAVMMMRRRPGTPASSPPSGAAGGAPPPAAANPPEWAEPPPPK
jgi:PKD repeat protein